MNVYLTFDIEVWCNGWNNLDVEFPEAFNRYVYGHSAHGDYALPKTLEILNRHGLKGVFFVEPLFATRFGIEYLEAIVQLIREAGQEIQLHLHPEWTDEAIQPIIQNCTSKRQHLSYYSLEEQSALIRHGKKLLEAAGSGSISAFRSGNFAANRDTFEALRRNEIFLDTSLNLCHAISAPELRSAYSFDRAFTLQDVTTFPVTVFKDGIGKQRPAQVGACGFSELRDALHSAESQASRDFVIVSHNFEMLVPDSSTPDWIVVKRFERLCAYLEKCPQQFNVGGFKSHLQQTRTNNLIGPPPRAKTFSTVTRYWEQILRRLPSRLQSANAFSRQPQSARLSDVTHE